MKRPMIYWGILFVLGVMAEKSAVWLLGTCGFMAVWLIYYKNYKKIDIKKDTLVLFLGVVFFLGGCVSMEYAQYKFEYCKTLEHETCEFVGKVIAAETKNDKTSVILQGHFVRNNKKSLPMCVVSDCKEKTENGELVQVVGTVGAFSKATNFGGFQEEAYRLGNGIFCKLENTKLMAVKKRPYAIRRKLEQLRMSLHDVYYGYFGQERASLACGMVLGEKQIIDEDVKALYQRNGIAHLIAISGLHIAMIGGVFYRLLKRMTGKFVLSASVGSFFIVLYGLMTGLAGSTVRAMIMLIVLFGADVFGRKYDVLSAVSLALLLMLAQNPFSLTQAGFLLSFGAVLGIAWVKPAFACVIQKRYVWLDGLLVSFSVSVMTLPIMLFYYYQIPLWSIFLNVIVVPCMSVLLGGLIACGILGSVWDFGTNYIAYVCNQIFAFYEFLCVSSEKLPIHTFCMGRPAYWWIFVYYGMLGLFLVHQRKNQKKQMQLRCGLIAWIVLLLICLNCPVSYNRLKVCMMDVGQGDGFYLSLPNHMNILIDGGSSSKKQIGKNVILSTARYFGADDLDYVFVTHSDQDHDNGIVELITDDQITIHHLVLPAIANPDESYLQLVALANEHGIVVLYMEQGDKMTAGEIQIQCLSPVYGTVAEKNNSSLCLWVQYRQFDMLFTGDMEASVEEHLIKQYGEMTQIFEVLKIAHHGSDTSSSESFIQWIQPQISFVSVGKNRYGHPTDTVLKRIKDSQVYRTDKQGAVLLTTDGKRIWVDTCKKDNMEEKMCRKQ